MSSRIQRLPRSTIERVGCGKLKVRTKPPYITELTQVREVSLLGNASLAFWRERLKPENLFPADHDGKAQLMIIGASMQYKGIHFTEVSFSILLSMNDHVKGKASAFLIQAFNSRRLFAWCERVLFTTPYLHGNCNVSTSAPISVQVKMGNQLVFRVEMLTDPKTLPRQAVRSIDKNWEGRVFLPNNCRGNGVEGRFFFAKTEGQTTAYPFTPARDALFIRPTQKAEIFQALLDSEFTVEEWVVRENATHGKSRSYSRSEISAP